MQVYLGPIDRDMGVYPRIQVAFTSSQSTPYDQTVYTVRYDFYEDSIQSKPSDTLTDTITAKDLKSAEKIAERRADTWKPVQKDGTVYLER